MNLDLESARTTRKRTYDDLAVLTTWNTGADGVDFNEVTSDCDQQPEVLVHKLLGQFEAEFSLADFQMSQQQIRIQRKKSAKILSNIQKLLLKTPIRSDGIVDEYGFCGYKEIKLALEFLIDRWGLGDIQIYNVLIETLLQSYMIAQSVRENVLLQEIILLDLLPCATGGESENCLHLQSAIARSLMEALSKCGSNSSIFIPIISWCKWYMNFYLHQKPYNIVRNEVSSNDITTASVPVDIYRLGLELLQKVPSVNLMPCALCINLDLIAFSIKSGSNDTVSLEQHSRELIATLRQRWTELFLPQDLRKGAFDCTTMRKETLMLECKRQLLNIFVIAIFDKGMNQDGLLTDAYIELLQSMTNKINRKISESQSYGTHKQIDKRWSSCDSPNFKTCDIDGDVNILTIDWIFVMMLLSTTKHQTLAIEIVDSWILSEAYDSLLEVIKIVFMKDEISEFPLQLPNNLQHTINYKHTEERFVPCLLKTAHVLLLKPQRDCLSNPGIQPAGKLIQFDTDSQTIETFFALGLFVHLDSHRQKEMINMLLHVTDECLFVNRLQIFDLSQININFNEANKIRSFVSTVIESVFTILQEVARVVPLKIYLKSKLIERLALPGLVDTSSPLITYVDRGICTLLVSLLKPTTTNDNFGIKNECTQNEALDVLQKLLFVEASHGNASHAIRGVLFATELISTKHYDITSVDERKLIHEWVLRLLLPCTRRMIEPELGLAGLSFFKGCQNSNSNKNVSMKESMFFQHIKMMVANTGLVQLLDNSRGVGKLKMSRVDSHVVLAYSSSVIDSSPRKTEKEEPRAMMFGIIFFLRRSNEILIKPSRWLSTVDWVYALMDTYLQIGRARVCKSWNPMNWLRAPIEFPTIDISFFNPTNTSQRLIIEFIDQKLCRFELSEGIQDIGFFPGSYAELVARRLYSKKLKLFIYSLRCFALALLTGMCLSAAVLKNAYEHSQTRDNTSRGLRQFIILQIIKIYDLRAKSTTMDSLFLAIDSALRRLWIRKKKVKLALSDDSNDSAYNPGLSLARRNKDIDILDSLSKILKASRNLRDILFGSTKYIGSNILWSALKDPSDSETIRKSMELLMCFKADELVKESVLNLSRTVDTKLHMIQQILKQLESGSLSHSESMRSNIQFCFAEISFFIPWLAKLRKRCAEVKTITNEGIVSHINKSLSLLVHFTSSYLQVIAALLQRVHRSSHFCGDSDISTLSEMLFKEAFIQFDTFQSNAGESDVNSALIHRLFNFFVDHLRSTEYAEIADKILEILSIIASLDDALTIKLFDLSWVHLHTVYVYIEANKNYQRMCSPFAITLSVSERVRSLDPIDQQSIARPVNEILQKLLRSSNCYNSNFLHLHIGMIRHWGILTASGDKGFPFLLLNLTTCVTTMKSLLESVNASVTRKAEIDERGTNYTRKQKSLYAPPIVGLEVATFPEFFETLLNLVVATAGTLNAGPQTNNRPTIICQRVIECVAIFRSLIGTYKDHIKLFPCKSAMMICCGSKDLLKVAVRQLQHCVTCRSDPPLLSNKQEIIGVHDAISVAYIEDVKDRILSYTVAPLLSLCDLWETSTISLKKSNLLSLRLFMERATRLIKDVSYSRSISSVSFGMERKKVEVRDPCKGFQMCSHNRSKGEQSLFVSFDDYNATNSELAHNVKINVENISVEDEESFEVVGIWAGGSAVDDQSDSICSLTIENPVSEIFHKK